MQETKFGLYFLNSNIILGADKQAGYPNRGQSGFFITRRLVMLLWFIATAIVSFIFGFIVSNRFSLSHNFSCFSLFWDNFVQFVIKNENKTVVLNERFLRTIAKDCINNLTLGGKK